MWLFCIEQTECHVIKHYNDNVLIAITDTPKRKGEESMDGSNMPFAILNAIIIMQYIVTLIVFNDYEKEFLHKGRLK